MVEPDSIQIHLGLLMIPGNENR